MDRGSVSQRGESRMRPPRPPQAQDQDNRMRPPRPSRPLQAQEHEAEISVATQTEASNISKKPLMKFMKKITQNKRKNSGGCEEWQCTLCDHVFKGSYTRVWHHLLGISGLGVRACTCSLEQRMDMTKLHMKANGNTECDIDGSTSSSSKRGRHGDASQSRYDSSINEETNIQTESIQRHSNQGGSNSKRSESILKMYNVVHRDEADDAIADFFMANGISFNATRSPYYKEMVKKIQAAGIGYVPPGYNKMRTSLLDRGVTRMQVLMEDLKQSWVHSGCSIVMDGWTNIQQRPLLNVIVTSPEGPYFLRAIDCSGKLKDATFMFEMLKDAIDEVGPSNVVHVITDAAPVCKAAGLMIQSRYRHIFWTPCCVHALNNVLKDIGKIQWIAKIISEAREAQMFICNHHASLAIYRMYAKKKNLKPAETRYATYFILLERMVEVFASLQATVVSQEWNAWTESKSPQAKQIRDMLLSDDWWADCRYVVSFTAPIVELIRYADSDSPTLGEIYECIDTMVGKIKHIIRQRNPSLEFFHEIHKVIEKRWNKLNTSLHMAAYALNPKWYMERPNRVLPIDDEEVKQGFLDAISKMYTVDEASVIREQFIDFGTLSPPTFTQHAKRDINPYAQKNPLGWWRMYGGQVPELRKLASRLLSQVASSSAAERNWSTYSFIHSVKRNRLTSKRAEKLVYVHSTLRLHSRKVPEYLEGPAARWDVDAEDAAQIDDDEDNPLPNAGLVGIPLDDIVEGDDDDDDAGSVPSEAQAYMDTLEAEDHTL